ncbi:MAG: hypothetical protein JW876_10855 [Candidatus Krumholzibacteriota bacterium]|nr:hypothetical protein [Candidatus Krumholzibacteriota bacterium]
MRKFAIAICVALLLPAAALAQVGVTVDSAVLNLGFMNVYNLPAPDGDGAYQFGQPWGFADLTAVYDGYDLTLGPNTIGDPNEYWYQCVGGAVPPNCGGPGAPGNKIMEANGYAEVTGPYAGQTVTFTGNVLAYSLTDAHVVYAFVKDYAPDYSSFNEQVIPLTEIGPFTVSLNTVNDPARHVQWGFQMVGVNVWVTDVEPFGSITIGPDYSIGTETSTWGAIKSLIE